MTTNTRSRGPDRAHRRAASPCELHRSDGLFVQARLRQAPGQAAENARVSQAQGLRHLPKSRARDWPTMMAKKPIVSARLKDLHQLSSLV